MRNTTQANQTTEDVVISIGGLTLVQDEEAALRFLKGNVSQGTVAWLEELDGSIRSAIEPGAYPHRNGRYSVVRQYACVVCEEHFSDEYFNQEHRFPGVCDGCVEELAGKSVPCSYEVVSEYRKAA